jgi:3-hydroxyacyl-CoA dehydrogenase
MQPIRKVAVVGGGLVGSGWAIVFARAGLDVSVYDKSDVIRDGVLARIRASLDDMRGAGLVDDVDAILRHVNVAADLAEALAGADYVQESVLERQDVKRAVSLEIDALMAPQCVVGSSSSGIPASAFTADCVHRDRFLVAHPVNPPHLIPLVELVPAPWTDPSILPWLRQEMERVGQAPIVVAAEIEGFILNRLQGALLNEAFALFEEGYVSAADLDLTVAKGLGYRWSFMGPFETIDLNAPGGIADYGQRLGPLYHAIAASRTAPEPWSDALLDKAAAERRAILPKDQLGERSAWRDRRLMALLRHKQSET